MNKLAFLLFFMLVIVSCRKDSIATGSIFVQVENNIGNVMPNAQVSLSPGTITGTTNALGNLLINDVEVGIYEVTATHPSIGSGMASAAIKENDVVDVTVKVITGTYVGPTVYISQPFSGYGYHGEELVF